MKLRLNKDNREL